MTPFSNMDKSQLILHTKDSIQRLSLKQTIIWYIKNDKEEDNKAMV